MQLYKPISSFKNTDKLAEMNEKLERLEIEKELLQYQIKMLKHENTVLKNYLDKILENISEIQEMLPPLVSG